MERINISLNPKTAKKLRLAAIEKYGNMRSTSRLIEDLIIAAFVNIPDIDAIKAARIEYIKQVRSGTLNAGCKNNFCELSPEQFIHCPSCGALFHMVPSSLLCCPCCRGSTLKQLEDEAAYKLQGELHQSALLTEEGK
jgi:Zn finger protein HypA/HybF involved in hydrogenase expression